MNRSSLLALVVLLITTLSGVASADNKTFPGSVCRGSAGEGSYKTQGQFGGTGDIWATCPIVRDNATERVETVWVRLANGTQATCSLQIANASGTSRDSTPEVTQLGGSIAFDGADLDHFSNGAYFVVCHLENGGLITSLRWEEAGDGSGTDIKVTPGMTCQSVVGQAGGFATIFGGFQSNGTSLVSVACPLFRDQGLGYLETLDVWVDPQGNDVIHCYVFSQDGDSTAFDSTQGEQSSGINPQRLSFDLDELAEYTAGSNVLRCDLGSLSEVTNIRWTQ